MKNSCDECEYHAGLMSAFKTYKQYKHEGAKYSCNECEYQAGFQSAFETHI